MLAAEHTQAYIQQGCLLCVPSHNISRKGEKISALCIVAAVPSLPYSAQSLYIPLWLVCAVRIMMCLENIFLLPVNGAANFRCHKLQRKTAE